MNNLIELFDINKFFGSSKNLKVLKKISYKFKKGKIYSLMGPSGSGKSTLLNLLSLIDRPTSGSIIIDKKQINFNELNNNDILRANKIGIIYQQDNLLPDFTALENIYLAGLAGENDKLSSINKAKSLLKKVGLQNRSDHYPSQLSGGEKQRVSIARALINNPQIILADEPTGSLDLETAKVIFDILKKQINSDRIIIFATHNRFFANKSDCILEMVNGNIRTING
jgi:ABC-type lipoprotein export system ATPase subunit|tara:strand:- start:163 stop:840 length:678 start_codon:yes stop_codon:yes gene_type:complete